MSSSAKTRRVNGGPTSTLSSEVSLPNTEELNEVQIERKGVLITATFTQTTLSFEFRVCDISGCRRRMKVKVVLFESSVSRVSMIWVLDDLDQVRMMEGGKTL